MRPNPTSTTASPARPAGEPVVEISEEHETPRGWDYALAVVWQDDTRTEHAATLSFADHDYWSGGSSEPARVLTAAVRSAASVLGPTGLPRRFDCSTLRRLLPDLDERVQRVV